MRTIDRIHETPELAPAIDDAIDWGDQLRLAGRACCCNAAPAVAVVLPPTKTLRHSTDLLLCGHHYRQSATTLAAAHATVWNRAGNRLSVAPGAEPEFLRLPF
jgi:hypothetical protein